MFGNICILITHTCLDTETIYVEKTPLDGGKSGKGVFNSLSFFQRYLNFLQRQKVLTSYVLTPTWIKQAIINRYKALSRLEHVSVLLCFLEE